MSDFKVVVTDKLIKGDGLNLLRERGGEVVVLHAYSEEGELAEAVKDADAMMARSVVVTAAVVEAAPRLKIISRHGVGYEGVDIEACTRVGIAVSISSDANSQSVAEYAFALMLSSAKNVSRVGRAVRSNTWARDNSSAVELHGKTLGIIGLGRIGSRLATLTWGFRMELLVHDPYATTEAVDAVGAKRVDLNSLLEQSDFVSLHVPMTDETRYFIGRSELKRMKPSAILVNTARGGLIDEAALHEALTNDRLAGAALDVFEEEPLPNDHPLTKLDNMVCTAHVAGQTQESMVRTSIVAAENILAVLRGDVPDILVNPEVLKNSTRVAWGETGATP